MTIRISHAKNYKHLKNKTMYTLTKEQHKLYSKLCDKYNSKYSPYYLLCSFDSFIESEVNKALKRTVKDESIKV